MVSGRQNYFYTPQKISKFLVVGTYLNEFLVRGLSNSVIPNL